MNIILHPSKILRKKTEKVKKIDVKIKKLAEEMIKIMMKNGGVGLAANQIGKNLSLFVAYDNKKFYVFINPEIEKFYGKEKIMEEGCLSIPKIWGEIKRYEGVILNYQNLFGKKKKLKAKGFLAQIIQHEIDHLNGILFIDKAINIHKLNE